MKNFWRSKTIMVQVLATIAAIVALEFPVVADFIRLHFAETAGGWAAVNIALRFITKDKIQIK